jgi:hypothetical protein
MALEAMGRIPDVSDVEAPTGTEFEPRAECTQKYAHAMERQQNLYDMVVNFSRRALVLRNIRTVHMKE